MSVLFFIFGAVFGSFFTVVGIRLPQKKSFIRGRSCCTACDQPLQSYDLIPIFSYILSKGTCKYCNTPISAVYITMELIMGTMWAWMYAHFGIQLELFIALLLLSMLHIIVVSDLFYMTIPNQLLLFFFPLFICIILISPQYTLSEALLGVATGFGVLYLVYIGSRGGLGGGDVKLFAVLGVILGVQQTLLTIFLACALGAIVGGILIFMNRIKRKEPIPFGPFIAGAAMISYVYGEAMINLYVRFH